ncbi:MAG: hypothetical protein AAF623_14895 [Planctomycetota bacterium]
MRPKRNRKHSSYGILESRQLLAADAGMFLPLEAFTGQQMEVIDLASSLSRQAIVSNGFATEGNSAFNPIQPWNQSTSIFAEGFEPAFGFGIELGFDVVSNFELAVEYEVDLDLVRQELFGDWFIIDSPDFGGGFEVPGSDQALPDEGEPAIDLGTVDGELLDLVDGTDGAFGTLDSENQSADYAFFVGSEGQVNVVVGSDVEEGELSLQLVDGDGEVVDPLPTDSDSAFTKQSYTVQPGEVYTLSVSGDATTETEYQLTVSFEETVSDPIDQHSDERDDSATVLEFVDGFAEVESGIETEGDRDVFQFVAAGSGDNFLFVSDTSVGSDLNLSVTVFDADGEEVVAGKTNSGVGLQFDTTDGETYFVEINANAGETGTYQFNVVSPVEAEVVDPAQEEELDLGDDADLASNAGSPVDAEEELDLENAEIVDVEFDELDLGDEVELGDEGVVAVPGEEVDLDDEEIVEAEFDPRDFDWGDLVFEDFGSLGTSFGNESSAQQIPVEFLSGSRIGGQNWNRAEANEDDRFGDPGTNDFDGVSLAGSIDEFAGEVVEFRTVEFQVMETEMDDISLDDWFGGPSWFGFI